MFETIEVYAAGTSVISLAVISKHTLKTNHSLQVFCLGTCNVRRERAEVQGRKRSQSYCCLQAKERAESIAI